MRRLVARRYHLPSHGHRNPERDRVIQFFPVLACVVLTLAASSVSAHENGAPTHPCAAVEDDKERLGCFDRAFPRPEPVAAPGTRESEDPDPEFTAAPVTPAAESFGLSEAQLRARDPGRASDSLDQIEARVAAIRHQRTGERLITLDNGQVWLQTEVTLRGPLKEGDTITIRRGALSSFLLVTPGRVALRVRRVE